MSYIFYKNSIKTLNTNLFYIVLLSIFLSVGSFNLYSQEIPKNPSAIPLEELKDSPPSNDNKPKDALKPTTVLDTIKKDSIKPKAFLEDKVNYKAKGYTRIDQKKKLITLHDKAELYYQDIELKSGIIVLNYEKNEVYAGRIKDSLGNYTQFPSFKQGTNLIEPDSIRFNFKTKKALIWNSRTEQGEFKVKARITKKENDSVYFLKEARFTTAEDADNPEYYMRTTKVKLIPGKKVITGFTNMVIYDVPTPLALPFAFFPLSTEESVSGLILPSYSDSSTKGFSLQNGGYYFALSPYYDLTVLGTYYTKGTYALSFASDYAKKYRFKGGFTLRYENLITSERGYSDYAKETIYNIQWSHSRDAKANPNQSFSASVNLGSTSYYDDSLNSTNTGATLNNTLSSSVSYGRSFNGNVKSRLSVAATHSQNTSTSVINMTLPNLAYSVESIYPFVSKDEEKKGFFKNINLQYDLSAKNSFVTTDSTFFTKEMFDDAEIGAKHTIPLSTNFKLFKYLSASTAVTYAEVWTAKTISKSYDTDLSEVVTSTINGFDAYRTYSLSSSLGTTIYGTVNFGDDKKIKAIRHVMRPTVSYSYTPSYDQYYTTYISSSSGSTSTYSRFEDGVFGAPSSSESSTLSFSLSNTFEAKVTDKDSTKTEPKKMVLLNSLNFSTSYNLNADGDDTLAWSALSISGGTKFFKEKMNVNFSTTLDPYAIDNSGTRVNVFNIDNGGSLFRMTSSSVTLNYALKSEEDKGNSQSQKNGGRNDDLFGQNTVEESKNTNNTTTKSDEIVDFFKTKLPLDITFAYSLTYSNSNRENEISGNSVMISANTNLSPKWKVGVSTGYDFVDKGFSYTQFRFERDLLSWRMSFNWVPLGTSSSWTFFIGIKASVLSDIKYDKYSSDSD
jgi:lipopolysaccharide assembly outer membrane protein LptD (OstA)